MLSPDELAARERRRAWYHRHGVHHAHCPEGCEHPQPFLDGGDLICGRCAIKEGVRSLMIPCHCD
jgi:hypothetical protein